MEPGVDQVKNIIAVGSGKGGVGKSTVSVNLAQALAREGNKVGVLDADLYGPSVAKLLAEKTPLHEGFEGIIPSKSTDNIKFLSFGSFLLEKNAAVVRAPIANSLIEKFIYSVFWEELDYLFIDLPPGTGDIHLTLMQKVALTGAVLVTTPQELALIDVEKAYQMFNSLGVSLLGVIENMSYYWDLSSETKRFLFGKGGGESFAKAKGIALLGKIPISEQLCRSGDHGMVFVKEYPEELAAKEFKHIARQVRFFAERLNSKNSGASQDFVLEWKS